MYWLVGYPIKLRKTNESFDGLFAEWGVNRLIHLNLERSLLNLLPTATANCKLTKGTGLFSSPPFADRKTALGEAY